MERKADTIPVIKVRPAAVKEQKQKPETELPCLTGDDCVNLARAVEKTVTQQNSDLAARCQVACETHFKTSSAAAAASCVLEVVVDELTPNPVLVHVFKHLQSRGFNVTLVRDGGPDICPPPPLGSQAATTSPEDVLVKHVLAIMRKQSLGLRLDSEKRVAAMVQLNAAYSMDAITAASEELMWKWFAVKTVRIGWTDKKEPAVYAFSVQTLNSLHSLF
jgi:hypothetical protein